MKYYLPKFLFSISIILFFTTFVVGISAQGEGKVISLKSNPIIPSGSFPIGIDINPITNKLYVANQFSNTISVIDIEKSIVEKNIQVGNSPYDIDVNPFSNRIYSSNRDSNSISVIDGFTNNELTEIPVGKSPLGIGINLATSWIYVANFNSGTITVIDAIDNHIIKSLKIASLPYDIVINPHTNKVYVTDLGKNSVLVLDGNNNTLVSTIPVGSKPSALAINTQSNTIYVSNFLNNSVSVINGTSSKLETNIKVRDNPVGIAVNPRTNKIYVNNLANNSVSVINGTTNKVIENISLEPAIIASGINNPFINIPLKVTFPLIASKLTVDPVTNFTYVTNTRTNGIMTIDGKTDKIIAKIFIDIKPENSGNVKCNDIILGSGESTTLPINSTVKCEAIPDRGYDFGHWSVTNNTNENPVIFNVTGYETITANFKGAILTETFIVLTSVVIGLVSTIGGWFYRQKSRLSFKRNLTNIDYTYEMLSKNNREECIKQLEQIQRDLNFLHRKGKINESQLEFLEKRI
ncbi:MAG TPA: YncE family protein, partial [Nitrososphaeraceae archaeon]|nr:YncE family protein [Nitrososphaeraceae archaeon]